MNEKDVLKKILALKDLKPNADWKKSSRDILLSQISNSSDKAVKVTLIDEIVFEIKNTFSFLTQPAFTVVGIFVLLASGVFGVNAAYNTKPGDSFYVAKILTDKARVAATFNREDRAKLEMKLASARAKEITSVLSNPSFNSEENKKKVEKLSENFKAEIKIVKDKYEEINKINENKVVVALAPNIASSNAEADNMAVGIGIVENDDQKVFVVGSGKATTGIQISQPELSIKNLNNAVPVIVSSSSSAANTEKASSTETELNKNLFDAEASFDTKDFASVKNILDQVDNIIKNIDKGEVKGVSESATSALTGSGLSKNSSSSDIQH